jgi:signal transduction histidine kinase
VLGSQEAREAKPIDLGTSPLMVKSILQRLNVQKLQAKVLILSFVASFVPILLLTGLAAWLVPKHLFALERTRLEDRVLAFKGYIYASQKGLKTLTVNYTYWTELFNAVKRRDMTWLKTNADGLLMLSDQVNALQLITREGKILIENNKLLRQPAVSKRISALIALGKPVEELIDTENGQVLLICVSPITRDDGTGEPPGTLVLAQNLNRAWLDDFLNYSQPTTQLKLFSLQGKLITSSSNALSSQKFPVGTTDRSLLPSSQALQAVQQRRSVYEILLDSEFNRVYSALPDATQPKVVVAIGVESSELKQASTILKRQIWIAFVLATLLSIAIARLLARTLHLEVTRQSLEKQTKELQQAKEAAEAASKAKSQFLANMSHELRTPLNAIIGLSQLLQEDALELGLDEQDFINDLQSINNAGKHLLALINDILDLSKIEAGKMALYWETVDIPVLIKDVITTVKPLMENNGNVLEVHCDERLGTMYADLTKVRQVLFNLLSNAAKFTHQGKVTLTVTRGEPHDLALGCQQQEPAAVVSSLYTRRCLNHAQVWRYWTRVGD